jgi:hypothetical protein
MSGLVYYEVDIMFASRNIPVYETIHYKTILVVIINLSNLLFCKNLANSLGFNILLRYKVTFEIDKKVMRYQRSSSFILSDSFFFMIFEVLFAFLQPYTFLLGNYSFNTGEYVTTPRTWNIIAIKYEINDLLLIPILVRTYTFVRFAISLSFYYNHRTDRIL